MLANNGYYELTLWGGHILQVWTEGRLCILRHPATCNLESDECRDKLTNYLNNEGLLDEVLGKSKIIMLDSYIE